MQRRNVRSFGMAAMFFFVALGVASCGDDDDSAATTSTSATASTSVETTSTLTPAQVAPSELRGRWVGMAGKDKVTLTLADGGYQISIAGTGSRFRPKLEYDGDTIRFLTTVDNCDQLAVYRWHIDGETLTLTPVDEDPCANRRFNLSAETFTREE